MADTCRGVGNHWLARLLVCFITCLTACLFLNTYDCLKISIYKYFIFIYPFTLNLVSHLSRYSLSPLPLSLSSSLSLSLILALPPPPSLSRVLIVSSIPSIGPWTCLFGVLIVYLPVIVRLPDSSKVFIPQVKCWSLLANHTLRTAHCGLSNLLTNPRIVVEAINNNTSP